MDSQKRLPKLRLRRERELCGWSQEDLAEKVGTTQKIVSRWELGESTPVPYYRQKLCKLFGKNAAELGLIDQEAGSEIPDLPSEKDTEKIADVSRVAPPLQHADANLVGVDLGGYQPIQIFLPNNTPHVVTIHTHQQEPIPSGKYSEKDAIIDDRGTYTIRQWSSEAMGKDAKLSRRETLGLFAGLPFLNLVKLSNLLHDEEFLSVCAVNIPIYWRFYFDGHLEEVEHELHGCLSQLPVLASLQSPHQKWAASLASKAHQLACMMELQPQNFGLALMHADQAIQCAHCAENPNLLVASLIRKALVFFYLKRTVQRLETYNEAYHYADIVSPLLKGRICMGLAEAYSSLVDEGKLEHEYTALRFLELMHNVFPSDPKEDQNFAYTHFKLPYGYEGLVYLNLGQPGKAWNTFVPMEKVIPEKIVPDRIDLSIRQARTSIALGDLEQSCAYLIVARNSSLALGSRLRYSQSCDAYDELLRRWPHEQRVRELGDLFVG